MLAALLVERGRRAAPARCSRGYGDPPDGAALRWHTAASLLAARRCPRSAATGRDLLARLRELLDAGSALLAPKAVAA